jgi:hypothetical protein
MNYSSVILNVGIAKKSVKELTHEWIMHAYDEHLELNLIINGNNQCQHSRLINENQGSIDR